MANPSDQYPQATHDNQQIRLDSVRVLKLTAQDIPITTGSALNAAPLVTDAMYILVATENCIVDFTAVATLTPNLADAVLLLAGERATVMLPVGATGFSTIALTAAGTLYIQQIETWAGLANDLTTG